MAAIEQQDPSRPGERLRTALLEALAEIASALEASSPGPRQVHLARRAAKRARSLARLAPDRLEMLARATRHATTHARRGFGAARDADVRTSTIRSLHNRLSDDTQALLVAVASASSPDAFGADRAAASAEIAALLRDWRLCDAQADVDQVVDAAARAYRRGRRRMKRARTGGTQELHDWRTAVVDYEYQAEFLGVDILDMRRRAEGADRMRRLLGDITDLDALGAWLHESPAAGSDARIAMQKARYAMAERRARLVEKAFALGATVYAERTGVWREGLRRGFARAGNA